MKKYFKISDRLKTYSLKRQKTLISISLFFIIFSVASAFYINYSLSQGKSYSEYISTGSISLNEEKVKTFSSLYPHCYDGSGTQNDKDFCLQGTIDYKKNDMSICHSIETKLWRKMCYTHYFETFPGGFVQFFDGHRDKLNFLFMFGMMVFVMAFTETMLASWSAFGGFLIIFIILAVTSEIDSKWACEGTCLPKILDWRNSYLPMVTITLFTITGFTIEKYFLAKENEKANWKHPEILDGEILIGNYSREDFENKLQWHTKRIGHTPYDKGIMLTTPNLYPIFIKKEEWEKHNLK